MRFAPQQTNNFLKISEIFYSLQVKLECLDLASQKWSGCPKALRVAPLSGLGMRWNQSMNMRLNGLPISSPIQDSKYIVHALLVAY